MKSSYGAVLTVFYFVWGRFDRKWGRFELGPFSIGAVLTGNPFFYVKQSYFSCNILTCMDNYITVGIFSVI